MDRKLINTFRNRINDGDWVYHQYRNLDGKNKWSVICSATDWIDVVVDEIDLKNLSTENTNEASVQMMKFIVCVDVLWEAVYQLHRAFFNTPQIPFKGECSIFKDRITREDDNDYFKTIRACFSTHPINLHNIHEKLIAPPPSPHFNPKEERWYASWSSGSTGPKDFSVVLSSNDPNKNQIFFDISFEELMQFAESRYQHLNAILREIDRQQKEYIEEKSRMPIQKSDDPISQIEILIAAQKLRLDNDYYNHTLEELRIIYATPITNPINIPIVSYFRKSLQSAISEIYDNIQEMKCNELNCDAILSPQIPHAYLYKFSNLCEFVYGRGCPVYVNGDDFIDLVEDTVNLSDYESYDELYVLILSSLFHKDKKKDMCID